MANFSALKTAIQNAIKQNGNEEITGDVLQQILLSIVSTMGDGAINTIEQNLSSETLARQGADNTLQSHIDSEAGARQSADNTLQSHIDAEALARGNADTQLQNAINAIKANIDNGYVYAGIATPTATPVSGKVFYIATAAGTYTNFGGQVLTQGINIMRYNGSAWSNQQLIGIDDLPTAGSNNLVKSSGVQNELALGAVYDVSAKNPTAGPNNDGKWESLSALLSDANLNTLIPTAYRKGGMSIKFVHTNDNKYVNFFCTADEFTTDVAQWQGVDNEPTDGSDNIVKSGGVAFQIQSIRAQIGTKVNLYNKSQRRPNGVIVTANGWSTSPLIPISAIKDADTEGIVVYQGKFDYNGDVPSVFFFDGDTTLIANSSIFRVITAGNKVDVSEIPANAVYIAVNCSETDVTLISNFSVDAYIQDLQERMSSAENSIVTINNSVIRNSEFITNDWKINDATFLGINGSATRLTTAKSGVQYEAYIYGDFKKGDVCTCEIAAQNIKNNGTIAFTSSGFSIQYITYPTVKKDVTLTSDATYIRVVINSDNIIADGDIKFTVTNKSSDYIKKDVDTLENTVLSVTPLTGHLYSRTDAVTSGTEYRKTIKCNFPAGAKIKVSVLGTGVKYSANASIVSDGFATQYLQYPTSIGIVTLSSDCTYITAVFSGTNIVESGSLTFKVELAGELDNQINDIRSSFGEIITNTVPAKTEKTYYNRIVGNFKAGERIRFIIKASNLNNGGNVAIVSSGFSATEYLTWPNNEVTKTLQNNTDMFYLSIASSVLSANGDIEFTIIREGLNTVTRNKKLRPMISVIDDDTLNASHVQTFRDACVANGIVGTFAVLTQFVYGDSTMTSLLKGYEREGFQMVLHGYSQGNFYRPEAANRDLPDCVEDMARGLQEFKELPFINYDYWVTPFGVADSDMKDLAKKFGLKCLVSIGQSATYIGKDFKNYNRYGLPRIGFNAADSSSATLQMLKNLIDDAADTGGWILIGTHIYQDWTQELIDTRFKEMVDYAKDKGLTFVTLGQGLEERKYLFDYSDMMGGI